MTNRREFLQIGIVATTFPLATQAARAATLAALPSVDHVPLYKVLYDLRFADSIAFARRVEDLGVAVQAIEGDMTRFWYDDLYHRWQRGPEAIAGLTAHGPLFCLERLAWDQGMRVVFRAEHKFAGAACVAHELTGPISMLNETSGLAGEDWAASIADVVTRCPSGRAEIASTARSSGRSTDRAEDSLYSWVIAPAIRG
jgi:hypothetical protein